MIDAGYILTNKLEESGFPVAAAFWLADPQINEWRIVFAIHLRLPDRAYR